MDDRLRHLPRPYVFLLLVVVIYLIAGSALQLGMVMQVGLILSAFACFAIPSLLYRWTVHRQDLPHGDYRGLGHLGVDGAQVAMIVVTSAVLGIVANLVAALFVEFIPSLQQDALLYEELIDKLLNPGVAWQRALAIIAVTMVAPLTEELLFRGTVLPDQLRFHRNAGLAIVLNGALFSLIHFNTMGFVSLAIVGAFFAHLTMRSTSLWPAIIAHAALNTVNGVILPLVSDDLASSSDAPELPVILAGLAVTAPMAAAGWWWLVRSLRPISKSEISISEI